MSDDHSPAVEMEDGQQQQQHYDPATPSKLENEGTSSSSEGNSSTADGERMDPRAAYVNRDAEASRTAHMLKHADEPHNSGGGKYIKSIVYGGLDGIITTFAVVAGIAGAELPAGTILILGFANLFADGISMGMGDYLSSQAETAYAKAERARETWECENYLEGEQKEMIELYKSKGMDEEDATQVVSLLSKNQDLFVDVMMVEELGLMPDDEDQQPWKNGLVTFLAFLIFGVVPLLTYLVISIFSDDDSNSNSASLDTAFLVACLLTLVTLFALGAFKTRFTNENLLKGGLYMMINGGLAAGAAFLIGLLLKEVIFPGESFEVA